MAKIVLIDSGALVAALWRRERHHTWARAHFEAAREPFVTCEAVISECFFLLERAGGDRVALCKLLERGIVTVDFSFADETPETLRLMRHYQDLPMSFADACLVRMAELLADSAVFTTDADFRTYRKNGRYIIPVIMPP